MNARPRVLYEAAAARRPERGLPIPDGESIVSGSLATCGPFTAYATPPPTGPRCRSSFATPPRARPSPSGAGERGVTVDPAPPVIPRPSRTRSARQTPRPTRATLPSSWSGPRTATTTRRRPSPSGSTPGAPPPARGPHGPGRRPLPARPRGNALALVCRDERGLDSLYVSDGATATFRHSASPARVDRGSNLFPVETGWFGTAFDGWRVLFVYPTASLPLSRSRDEPSPPSAARRPMYACRCTDGTLISLETRRTGEPPPRVAAPARPMAPPAAVA
eukprot:tig00000104_g4818.t1